MYKRNRPWDKTAKRQVRRVVHDADDAAQTSSSSNLPPHVEIGSNSSSSSSTQKFWSDRFYLNSTGKAESKSSDGSSSSSGGDGHCKQKTSSNSNSSCWCRQGMIPDDDDELSLYLDRSQLVESLDLKAAIIGTYAFDFNCFRQEFPSLFGGGKQKQKQNDDENPTVPCLVLHGKKGWTLDNRENGHGRDSNRNLSLDEEATPDEEGLLLSLGDDVADNHQDHNDNSKHLKNDDDDDNDMMASVGTQDEDTIAQAAQAASSSLLLTQSPSPKKKEQQQPPVEEVSCGNIPDTVHFSEIKTTWLPPVNNNDATTTTTKVGNVASSSSSFDDMVNMETGYLQEHVIQMRLHKPGVHHPKFMILLEKSGSVVVVVSTANFTPRTNKRRCSTDGSWVQRFPPASSSSPSSSENCSSNEGASTTTSNEKNSHKNNNDFGTVLAHFLQCQMLATAPGQVTIHWFVQKYLGWKSLLDLERLFDYSRAQVHLVTTVPGEYETTTTTTTRYDGKNNNNNNNASSASPAASLGLLRQRMQQMQLSLRHDEDRIIFQPTSLGGEWNEQNMSDLVRSLLYDQSTTMLSNNTELLERANIVWPTDHFVRQVGIVADDDHDGDESGRSPDSVRDCREISFASQDAQGRQQGEDQISIENGGVLFLSSESFNRISLSCLSRMVMYEPMCVNPLVPHFKSIARVFGGSDYRIRKDQGVAKCQNYFSWFLLTSACLSRGAQGEATANRAPGSDSVSYSNFELGVLFDSQIDGAPGTRRLYCWKPTQCCCTNERQGRSSTRLIPLPIPYDLSAPRYVEDPEDICFCETPYFHEIPKGTATVGNMQLTPYGQFVYEKHNK